MEMNSRVWTIAAMAVLSAISAFHLGEALRAHLPKTAAASEILYGEAVARMEQGEYESAIPYLVELKNYRNSDDLLLYAIHMKDVRKQEEEEQMKAYSMAETGSVIHFGSCQIDGISGDDPIAWRVVYRDGNRLLLVSEYVLNVIPFFDGETGEGTWNDSFLKQWLNRNFYAISFNDAEKQLIRPMCTDSSGAMVLQGGTKSDERVFVLSREEVQQFLDGERAQGIPTSAVKLTYENIARDGFTRYWTRSGSEGNVYTAGGIRNGFLDVPGQRDCGVRPALWMELPEQRTVRHSVK